MMADEAAPQAGDQRLARQDLVERMRHFNMASHLSTADLIAGGVVAVAAVVGLQVAAAVNQPTSGEALRALLWGSAFALFTMVHAYWRQGGLLSGARINVADYLAPMLVGLFELGEFLVLGADFQRAAWPNLWCAIASGHLAAAALLVHARLFECREEEYGADSADFVRVYRDWNANGRNVAAVLAVLMAGAAAATWLAPQSAGVIAAVAGALTAIFAVVGLFGAAQSQRMFLQVLSGITESAAFPRDWTRLQVARSLGTAAGRAEGKST